MVFPQLFIPGAAAGGNGAFAYIGTKGPNSTAIDTNAQAGDYAVLCRLEKDLVPTAGGVNMTLISSHTKNNKEVSIWGVTLNSTAIADGSFNYGGRSFFFRPPSGATITPHDGGFSDANPDAIVTIDMTSYTAARVVTIGCGRMDDTNVVTTTPSYQGTDQIPTFDGTYSLNIAGAIGEAEAGYSIFTDLDIPTSVEISANSGGNINVRSVLCTAVIEFDF